MDFSHNLPLGFATIVVGQNIGNFLGEFLDYDDKHNSISWMSFMKIRVLLDITKPLECTKKIRKEGGDEKIINFKYERLSLFCYLCGFLGHTEDFCSKLFKVQVDDGQRSWDTPPSSMAAGSRYLREEGQSSYVAQQDLGVANSMPFNSNLKPANNEALIAAEKKHNELLIAALKSPNILLPQPSIAH